MNFIGFDGKLGDGKTLGMTILALYFQSKSGCTTFSNYGVRGSELFTHYTDLLKVAVQPSSIIMLDEAHADLDARNFATNSVKFFTHLSFYFRKLRTTMMMTTPLIENLDTRIRGIMNLYCHVTKTKTHFIYDMYDPQIGTHLKRYKISKDAAFQIANETYGTYNMVMPVDFPQERKEFHEFLELLKATSENYYVNRLKNEIV